MSWTCFVKSWVQPSVFAAMKRLIGIIVVGAVVLILMVVATGCSERQEHRDALNRAISLMDNRPDSALSVLDSLGKHKADFGHHFSMQYCLHRLNAYNKLDTVFRTTDEANQLVTYFEDHGTSNEQMLAYYLLGRAYYDLHEAPQALRYYQIAIERADTADDDCNYRLLSRVYGQMGSLFYYQNLMEKSLQCDDKSIEYGLKGKDTLNAILSMPGKSASYGMLSKKDSAIYIAEQASALAHIHGYEDISAAILGGIIRDIVEKGELMKAKQYMDQYELSSGYFDKMGNIEKGRETYYYSKGLWYLYTNNLDSAEFFFRKELREGRDFNNQNAGSRGLTLVYQQKHIPDSAAKYALYSYAMNDSVYAQMATDKVEQMQALYDYSRHQEIAQQERDKRERIEKEKETIRNISIGLLFVVLVSLYLIKREKRKRHEEHNKYVESVANLAKAQTELNRLRSHREEFIDVASDLEQMRAHEHELNILIEEKEKEVEGLLSEIEAYKEKAKFQVVSAEDTLKNSPLFENIKKKADRGTILSEDEWQELNKLVIETLPNFYNFISSKKHNLNNNEFKICILRRLDFTPKTIANMLNLSPSSITKIRNNMSKKLFGEEDNSKEFDKMLKQLF